MPLFFIPAIGFSVWLAVLIPYLSFLRLDLHLSEQLLSAHIFASYLILLSAWAFSGPGMAAGISFLLSGACVYLFLVTKEPAYLLQILFYAVFYVLAVFYFLKVQRKTNNKRIFQEKLIEDTHSMEEEIEKKDRLKKALEMKIILFLGLRRFSETLKGLTSTETTAKKITGEAFKALEKAEECVLYLVDENEQKLSLAAGQSRDGSVVGEKECSLFDQWVMKRSQGLVVEDSRNDFRFPTDVKTDLKRLRSVCVSPLMIGNKVLGVLRASALLPRIFHAEDLRLLDIFSNLGSVALKNQLLYAKMQEMAIHDGLTGLYLHRYFQDKLSEERLRASAAGKSFALILCDIDYFKRCNDDYGHSAGDIVLKNVASILSEGLGPQDLAARYGGEEFIVLLPDKGRKEALQVAEKLRAGIEANTFIFRRMQGNVTASFGVAVYPEDGRNEESLLQKADRALYQAKHLGRNRVCG